MQRNNPVHRAISTLVTSDCKWYSSKSLSQLSCAAELVVLPWDQCEGSKTAGLKWTLGEYLQRSCTKPHTYPLFPFTNSSCLLKSWCRCGGDEDCSVSTFPFCLKNLDTARQISFFLWNKRCKWLIFKRKRRTASSLVPHSLGRKGTAWHRVNKLTVSLLFSRRKSTLKQSPIIFRALMFHFLWRALPKMSRATLPCCHYSFFLFKNPFIYRRTGTFKMIYWHWAELAALILHPATQLKALTMCCWLHAHSHSGHFMRWRRVWPCRDSSPAAACNMWPHCLPGSPLSIFHYLLFNLSPWCQTAVHFLKTFSSCQNIFLFPLPCFVFTQEISFVPEEKRKFLFGRKVQSLKLLTESCSVKYVV